MKELQKFQNSTFDEFTIQKFIEDQKNIMELSGRLQELQNEVNCMNDSKDFQDAESICSGNPHVTSRPVSFPPHPIPEGMLSRSIGMQSHMLLHQLLILKNCIHGVRQLKNQFTCLQRRKVEDQNETKI